MDADTIYRELGKLVVCFQEIENQLIQIGCFILDPIRITDARERLGGLWFKRLTDDVEKLFLDHIDRLELEDAVDQKGNFQELVERCRKLAHYRNKLVHSTYIHLEADRELVGILRSKIEKQADAIGESTLAFDQEPMNEASFKDSLKEIAEVAFLLSQTYIQLIHWHGKIKETRAY
jgi:hypothetical protein